MELIVTLSLVLRMHHENNKTNIIVVMRNIFEKIPGELFFSKNKYYIGSADA